MTAVDFVVLGKPMPQGSIKAYVVAGRARMTASGGDEFTQWRNDVVHAARQCAGALDMPKPLDGPLELGVTFQFPMPASRSKAERERGRRWKDTAPDLDKLVRAVGDALTASGLIADDARIVRIRASKRESTGLAGARITVRTLGPEEA